MKSSLKNLYHKSLFDNSFIGLVFNPSFLVRSSLHRIFSSKSVLFNGKDVLDVGCGSKPYKEFFHMAKSYKGIDTNNSGHDHKGEEIDLFYDGKTMPLADGTCDAVVSFQVLEHVLNADMFITEIRRVLKKDGLIMMSIPFVWPEHEQPFDFRRFTSFGVEEVFKRHGFEINEIIKTTNFPQTILQMTCTYLALALKTKSTILNLFLIALFNPLLNILGILAGFSRNYDLFCDVVVIARKTKDA